MELVIQTLLQVGTIPATIFAVAKLVDAYGSARSKIILAKAMTHLQGARVGGGNRSRGSPRLMGVNRKPT